MGVRGWSLPNIAHAVSVCTVGVVGGGVFGVWPALSSVFVCFDRQSGQVNGHRTLTLCFF